MTEDFRAIADVARLQVAAVYGGVGIGPQAKRARHADILVATPGRLLDLVQRKLLRLDRVRICVLDEADRMLDMGFLPDVQRILEMLQPDRQTMPFRDPRRRGGRVRQPVHARRGAPRGGRGRHHDHRRASMFICVEHPNKTEALARGRGRLRLAPWFDQDGADRWRGTCAKGFQAGELHGMSQPQRERSPVRERRERGWIATDVAARGSTSRHHPRDQLRRARRREGVRAPRNVRHARAAAARA